MLFQAGRTSQPAPAASQRPVLMLRYRIPSAKLTVTRHQPEVQVLHPSDLPLACSPRMERAPLGFSPSFEPRREHQRRTSGRGQALSTSPEPRLRYSPNLQSTRSLQCVRPRVANPSDLPLACDPRMEQRSLGLSRELRTPRSLAAHVGAGTGHRARTWINALGHRVSLQSCVDLSMRATSRRTRRTGSLVAGQFRLRRRSWAPAEALRELLWRDAGGTRYNSGQPRSSGTAAGRRASGSGCARRIALLASCGQLLRAALAIWLA